ncbi:MAG: SRPBCC family protein [Gammaproteobacteria bacterium]|nr:SRPBCC family protein [Gammaproteobacteria bacterium]
MALVSYRTRVNARLDVLWKHLLEKVETPEKFIPAVTRSEILERLGPNTRQLAARICLNCVYL